MEELHDEALLYVYEGEERSRVGERIIQGFDLEVGEWLLRQASRAIDSVAAAVAAQTCPSSGAAGAGALPCNYAGLIMTHYISIAAKTSDGRTEHERRITASNKRESGQKL